MNEGRDPNRLIKRVDALMRRQQEDTQRAVEEVPLLTEIVEHDAAAATPEAVRAEETLAADIERVLVVRLIPELNKQIAGLRSELEKELRRSVREAVEHALAVRKANPDKS
ncbi:MAG: hypothetical protein AABM33_06415 [Pseudomonadota bacterium]